jgi:hypothetical protein
MNESNARMIEPGPPPSLKQVEEWMGEKAFSCWTRLSTWIAQGYPKVFTPEWLFGGRKHGWFLRYKKSKSFCSLIPEKNRFAILIVFGADERAKVETIRPELSAPTREAYDNATTFHDGKWLYLLVNNTTTFRDVQRLLAVKRRIKSD